MGDRPALNALVKLANVASVFEAAQVLERHGLLGDRNAASIVREYVAANPEINDAMRGAYPAPPPAKGESKNEG